MSRLGVDELMCVKNISVGVMSLVALLSLLCMLFETDRLVVASSVRLIVYAKNSGAEDGIDWDVFALTVSGDVVLRFNARRE